MATDNKYDRQLRLWGADGQRRLSESHIVLLKGGPTGTETLKNLVLPGIGKFTVVDDQLVTPYDVGNNFFVTSESQGKHRAVEVCAALKELNPDVEGFSVVSGPVDFLKNNDLTKYSLVVATELTETQLLEVEVLCKQAQLPIVAARTLGFTGLLRVCSTPHCVVESKPSPTPAEDIRIANPFEALQSFSDSVDVASLCDKDYKHVPYIIILLKQIGKWRAEHDAKPPQTTVQKKEFKEQLKQLARKPWGEEENLLEAYENAFLAYVVRGIPEDVEEVLQDPQCKTGICTTSTDPFNVNFWVMARALKEFVACPSEGNGCLPLSGILPDMTSTTDLYIGLQNVYKKKALADAAAIEARVATILKEHGRGPGSVSTEEIRTFCKNAYNIHVSKLSSMQQEFDAKTMNKEDIEMNVMEGVGDHTAQCPLLLYFLWRGCDRFHKKHGRYPGENGKLELEKGDKDAAELFSLTQTLVGELALPCELSITMAHAKEFSRYGGCELHNIASFIGGIASQEVVKLITHQYKLINNTYIFNGITCTGLVYNF